ncbi:MAG: hypothetical protein R3F59_01645 [Myxococcota bacterium]
MLRWTAALALAACADLPPPPSPLASSARFDERGGPYTQISYNAAGCVGIDCGAYALFPTAATYDIDVDLVTLAHPDLRQSFAGPIYGGRVATWYELAEPGGEGADPRYGFSALRPFDDQGDLDPGVQHPRLSWQWVAGKGFVPTERPVSLSADLRDPGDCIDADTVYWYVTDTRATREHQGVPAYTVWWLDDLGRVQAPNGAFGRFTLDEVPGYALVYVGRDAASGRVAISRSLSDPLVFRVDPLRIDYQDQHFVAYAGVEHTLPEVVAEEDGEPGVDLEIIGMSVRVVGQHEEVATTDVVQVTDALNTITVANRLGQRVSSVPFDAGWDVDPYWRFTAYDLPHPDPEAVSLDHIRPWCEGYAPTREPRKTLALRDPLTTDVTFELAPVDEKAWITIPGDGDG